MSSTLPATRVAPAQPPSTQPRFGSIPTHPSAATLNAFLLRIPASMLSSPMPPPALPAEIARDARGHQPEPAPAWPMSFWTRSAP